MEENFEPVARTRANYYTPGSPVQFVCVELLKGEQSGEHAVCLTFKNISRVVLTALEIRFKCKGVDGVTLCEDSFEYRDINVKPGELFGQDEAVFMTHKAITSVDVSLINVYNGKRVVHLDSIRRVRLPAPRRLSAELEKMLESRMGREELKYMPQVFENGWYCACGAFHPKEEDTVYCSECGCDRILLQNALNTLLQPEQRQQAEPVQNEDRTRIAVPHADAAKPVEEATRVVPPRRSDDIVRPASFTPALDGTADDGKHTRVVGTAPARAEARTEGEDVGGTRVVPTARRETPAPRAERIVDDEQDDEADDRDGIAETLIRWVPPITAIVCAAIALWGFVYYQFAL